MSATAEDFKELVRSRTDLVELIGERLRLIPKGRLYVGLCPFHDDHNPSMQVNPERQTYRCWVCNEGGDCFSFVMKHDKLGFREALELLAARVNLEVPKAGRRDGEAGPNRKTLSDVLKWAEEQFHQYLLNAADAAAARAYLQEQRRFSDETIRQFRLGYHPNKWDWLQERARGKFPTELLVAARLIGEREKGPGFYDFFVDRVLFPIHDEGGRTVAFGGRVLPGNTNPDLPKYWNSPESAVFSKSRLVYGLDMARETIRQGEMVVVVEGYTDCIALHQAGFRCAVGTLGTALTELHVTLLKRLARKVVLVYDGDDAGRNAAERALVKFLAQDVDLRILTLPRGLDPDEFLAEEGPEAFQKLCDDAPEAWEYKLPVLIERHGADTLDARHRILEEMLDLLSHVPNFRGTPREDLCLGTLARRLLLNEQVVRRRLREVHGARSQKSRRKPLIDRENPQGEPQGHGLAAEIRAMQEHPTKDDLLECELLEILFTDPSTISTASRHIGLDDFRNPHLRDLLGVCFDLAEQGTVPTFDRVLDTLETPERKSLAVWIDERAQDKDVAGKLADNSGLPGTRTEREPGEQGHDVPRYLAEVFAHLGWRREQEAHQALKGDLVAHQTRQTRQTRDKSPELARNLELLRQISHFHQQRATKKSLP